HPKSLLPVWEVAVAASAVLGVTAISVWQIRRLPFLAAGWFWYLGTLVPVIGLVQVGLQSRADRYMYIPLIGIFIVIAWSLKEFLARRPSAKTAVTAAASVAIVILALIAHIQTGYWQDSVGLFTRAVSATQNNYVAENNLGEALGLQGKTE